MNSVRAYNEQVNDFHKQIKHFHLLGKLEIGLNITPDVAAQTKLNKFLNQTNSSYLHFQKLGSNTMLI